MDKPIWELLVKEGVKTERGRGKSLLIWRSSHVLCDGWSIFKLTARLFDTPDNVGKEMIRQSGKFSWKGILTWCTLPYDFADYVTNVESDDTSVSPPSKFSQVRCHLLVYLRGRRGLGTKSPQLFDIPMLYKPDFLLHIG